MAYKLVWAATNRHKPTVFLGLRRKNLEETPLKKPSKLKSYLNVTMHDSDWLAKAFTLSLVGYSTIRETAVRHSDWLYRVFSHVKIKIDK